MEFGIGMGRRLATYEIADHARVAEECGFAHTTFIDSQNLCRDVYVMMTLAAQATRRIRIGHGVTNPFTRHPAVTANASASLHELSGGRAFIGIGPGMSSTGTLGKAPRSIKELRRTIEVLNALTSGQDVEYDGQTIRSEWSRRRVPIYLGSDGPKSMRLAGELADGVFVTGVDPRLVTWRLNIIRQGAEQAGRDPDACETWIRTTCFIAPSRDEARDQVRSYAATMITQLYFSVLKWNTPEAAELARILGDDVVAEIKQVHDAYEYYQHERIDAPHRKLVTDRLLDANVLWGTVDDVIEGIQKVHDAGGRRISLTLYNIIDKKGFMRAFNERIMPHFRRH